MRISISDTYQSMSILCAGDLIRYLEPIAAPLLCVASGDTPKGMYAALVELIHEKKIDTTHWHFVGLDEWANMNGSDQGSCRFHLNNQLFHPLGVEGDKIIFFDGRAEDLQAECDNVEDFIRSKGGIDVAVIGLGMNGHIGMNEPGTPVSSRAHLADIDETTQKVGQKYFTAAAKLDRGVTLGIGSLREARHIMLLASGSKKAAIVQKIVTTAPTPVLPATLIADHQNICVYLDKEAAERSVKKNDP